MSKGYNGSIFAVHTNTWSRHLDLNAQQKARANTSQSGITQQPIERSRGRLSRRVATQSHQGNGYPLATVRTLKRALDVYEVLEVPESIGTE